MHVNIPELERCCFCFPLRCGIQLWAYMKLFATGLFMPMFCLLSLAYLAFAYKEHAEHVFLFMTFIIMAIDVIFDVILIVATHKRSVAALRIYIIYGFVHAASIIILTITWISYEIGTENIDLNTARTQKNLAISLSLVTIILLLQAYMLIVIKNEIVKLQTGNGFGIVNYNTDPECFIQPPDVEQAV